MSPGPGPLTCYFTQRMPPEPPNYAERRTEDKAARQATEVKGKIKEGAGRAADGEELQAEGQADQAQGHLKQAGGKDKDASRK